MSDPTPHLPWTANCLCRNCSWDRIDAARRLSTLALVLYVAGMVEAEYRKRSLPLAGIGADGIRDPEFPCEDFRRGEADGLCEGDGHYLCGECSHLSVEP